MRLNTSYYFRVGTCQELLVTAADVESCDLADVRFASERSFILSRNQQGASVRALTTPAEDAGSAPAIRGSARVGATLTADTAAISDDDGVENAVFTHQWLAGETDIKNATGSSYTLTENELGRAIRVRVSFTDDAGNPEARTSLATAGVEPRSDIPATGAPVIMGTARVGETLTADTSGISDEDGLSSVAYGYQWLADDADIAGATARAYTLVDADAGAIIRVRVSFTDDAGHEETLTSKATEPVSLAVQQQSANSPATGAPTISGAAQVGQTLTADATGIADEDGLTQASFTYRWLRLDLVSQVVTDITGATGSSYVLTADDRDRAISVSVSFTDDAGNDETLTSYWVPVFSSPNSPATGQPAITGTVQVGETLTEDTSGIADDDGLNNVVYSYQWLADDAEITGASASTYTLTDSDEGKTIKVQVSFTDDAGNEETLTSTATATVEARSNRPATGQPTILGTAQVGETLTADTSSITDADGLSSVAYGYQWLADGADIAGASGSSYTLTDSEVGKTVQVQVTFTDDEGHEETLTSTATATVDARPNSPATGQPAISGTVQVGETLTASTSGIADDDGLSSVAYGYQWLADGTDIAGATATTYTLQATDEGAAIKVRVSFTDDAGHEETLTSKATKPVALPLTGSLHDAAESHDGLSEFTFELRFSENVRLSYKKLRDHAFTVTGGTVQNAQRIVKSSNIRWRITVAPDSDSAVQILLPATTRCGLPGGICASGGRKFSSPLELTVSGP